MHPESHDMPPDALTDAAALIADGVDLDWGSISSSLATDEEREVADELAALAVIAGHHRRLHQLLPSDLAPGVREFPGSTWGHLELLEVLGSGSYGTVYRAWDGRLDRDVALKLFHGARNPEAVMREGKMLARIHHDNVVTVYGADVIDGVAGIWMEYVRGRTLEQLLKEQGPLKVEDATRVGIDVARALAAVHDAGVLHCDVKAQNLIRESGGRLVLTDFGGGRLASAAASDKKEGLTGTPRYMAPEVFEHKTATEQSDLYSVGVLLYYLSSGRFPVDGKTLGEIRQAHGEGRRQQLRDVRSDLPAGFVREVEKALHPDATRRHQSARELESALVALVTPSVTPLSRGRWTATAAVTAIATAGLVASLMINRTAAVDASVRTVAVLPIRNFTGDPSNDVVAKGLTQVLAAKLSRITSLSVSPVSAVLPPQNSAHARTVAEGMGVQRLIAGSVTEAGERIRLEVRLIDPTTGSVIWRHRVSRDSSEILAAQSEIAVMLAGHLSISLSGPEQRALQTSGLDERAQYAYLRGLATSEGVLDRKAAQAALLHLQEATAIEPRFADAWAEQALAELRLMELETDVDRIARARRVKELAQRALDLDPASPTGLLALGTAQFYHDWDLESAEQSLRLAMEFSPSSTITLQRLAMLLAARGRTQEAVEIATRATQLDRLNATRRAALAQLHYYARDFAAAEREANLALEMAPGLPAAAFVLGRVYSAVGDHPRAIAHLERALTPVRRPSYVVELARAHAAAGHRSQVDELLRELRTRAAGGEGFDLDNYAYIAAAEGRSDDAFAILSQAVEQRLPNVLWLKVDPRVDSLRSDPRFTSILAALGVEP